jgi:hypothetical protein
MHLGWFAVIGNMNISSKPKLDDNIVFIITWASAGLDFLARDPKNYVNVFLRV